MRIAGYIKNFWVSALHSAATLFRPVFQGGLYLVYILTRLTVNPVLRMRRVPRYRSRETELGISTIENIYALRQLQSKGKTGSR